MKIAIVAKVSLRAKVSLCNLECYSRFKCRCAILKPTHIIDSRLFTKKVLSLLLKNKVFCFLIIALSSTLYDEKILKR